jgi:hypothetical protein
MVFSWFIVTNMSDCCDSFYNLLLFIHLKSTIIINACLLNIISTFALAWSPVIVLDSIYTVLTKFSRIPSAFHVTIYIKKNSVALVRKRTISTEQPPLVGEVSANFSG